MGPTGQPLLKPHRFRYEELWVFKGKSGFLYLRKVEKMLHRSIQWISTIRPLHK